MSAMTEPYDELRAYTLSLADAEFLHQHVIDAYAVQEAGDWSKPISVAFGLAGLWLYIERDATGRDVQRVHRMLGAQRKAWPVFHVPEDRGEMGPIDVMEEAPGPDRDAAIRRWCESVWAAIEPIHGAVETWLRACDIDLG
jgi:hypothetical protein